MSVFKLGCFTTQGFNCSLWVPVLQLLTHLRSNQYNPAASVSVSVMFQFNPSDPQHTRVMIVTPKHNHHKEICLYYYSYRANDITYYQEKNITSTSFLLTRHYAGVGPFENLPARTVIRASLTSNSSRTAPKLDNISKYSDPITLLLTYP
jgi:hypothetical protein